MNWFWHWSCGGKKWQIIGEIFVIMSEIGGNKLTYGKLGWQCYVKVFCKLTFSWMLEVVIFKTALE